MATVELEQRPWVHAADAVAVRHHERLATELVGEPAKPSAGLCLEPRVTEVHRPVLAVRALHGDLVRAQVDAQAVPEVEVVEEVALDDVAAIAECDDELLEAACRVAPHDMPENRPSANLHHRLWLRFGFLGQTGSKPAGEQHRLHRTSSRSLLENVMPLHVAERQAFDEPSRSSETRQHGGIRAPQAIG